MSIVDLYRNRHVEEIFSFSYLLKLNGKKIYYSGDTCNLDKHVLEFINEGDIDISYIDTCSTDYESNVHLSLQKLSKMIDPKYRDRVWCMHLDEGFDISEAKSLGFNVVENI